MKSFEKAKEDRTYEDYQILREALGKVPFLTDNAAEGSLEVFLTNCADMMEYEYFPKGSAIFHFGETGRKFYLILRGSVDVFIPKSKEELQLEFEELEKEAQNAGAGGAAANSDESEELKQEIQVMKSQLLKVSGAPWFSRKSVMFDATDKKQESTTPSNTVTTQAGKIFRNKTNLLMKFGTFSKQMQANNDLIEIFSKFEGKTDLYIQNGIATMKKVRNMGPGNYFGEVALSTDKPRSASVIAAEDVHVVSLTKRSYKAIFEASIRMLEMKAKFFEDFFNNCGKDLANKFAYVFKERTYEYGQVFYSEGDQANEVFLLKEGEVQVRYSPLYLG